MADRPQEIERKWRVRRMPDLTGVPSTTVSQGYLAIAADGTEVRIRRKGDRYFETVKSQGGLRRGESEVELSAEQFAALWPATEGRRLKKTRYDLEWNGHELELDVYHKSLAGLTVVECEFESADASKRFSPPDWFGAEVTEDPRYKNNRLALNGLPEAL